MAAAQIAVKLGVGKADPSFSRVAHVLLYDASPDPRVIVSLHVREMEYVWVTVK